MSKDKPEFWVARNRFTKRLRLFVGKDILQRDSFLYKEYSHGLPELSQFQKLTHRDDPIPVSIIPTAELEQKEAELGALRELAEAAKVAEGLVDTYNEEHVTIRNRFAVALAEWEKVRK